MKLVSNWPTAVVFATETTVEASLLPRSSQTLTPVAPFQDA